MTSLEPLPNGWSLVDGRLHRRFQFASFVEAFSFMAAVALVAERLGHHPEWTNVYGTVTIDLVTHDAGDVVTDLDLELARQISDIAER